MEADPGTKPTEKNLKNEQKENSNSLLIFGGIFQPLWIRRNSTDVDKFNRFYMGRQNKTLQ